MGPRFSLFDLLLATTLLAVGVCGASVLLGATVESWFVHQAAPVIYFGSAIATGMGLGAPFHKKTTGGVAGFVIGVLVLHVMTAALLYP